MLFDNKHERLLTGRNQFLTEGGKRQTDRQMEDGREREKKAKETDRVILHLASRQPRWSYPVEEIPSTLSRLFLFFTEQNRSSGRRFNFFEKCLGPLLYRLLYFHYSERNAFT